MVDQVKVAADEQAPAEQSLRRNLTNRHIQLIAIGGVLVPACLWDRVKRSVSPDRRSFLYI